MANEFIARKGLIALADSQITGSLNISQNIVAAGTVQATFASNTGTAISGAFDAASSSLATRITSQENFSSSLDNTFATDADLNLVSSSVDSLNAATSSYLQNTTDTLTGDLTVTGTLTAQDLHVQEVTSSIVYSSGSNIFGTLSSDTQTFNGSLQVSGSTNYLLGDVGIGTTSPGAKLHVDNSAADAIIRLSKGSSTIGNIDFVNEGNRFSIQDDGARRLVIDTSGNVGIGTTSPDAKLDVVHPNSGTDETRKEIQRWLHDGQNAMSLFAYGNTADTIQLAAWGSEQNISIVTETLGSITKDTIKGIYIKSGGYVHIGGTSNLGYNSHNIQLSAPSSYACIVRNSDTSTTNCSVLQFNRAETTATTNGYCVIYRQGDTATGTNRWIVFANGNIQNSNNSYGSLSDERKKENIVDATPKLDDLMKVKVRNFNLIGEETKQIGVVAQELEQVFPGMISESKDPDSDDETLYKSVKYSVFVPMLIKSIQELKAEIETLKTQING